MLTFYDYQLIVTTGLFIILGMLHEYAGTKAYVKGSSMGVFKNNANWIPTSSKEKTLLGVFYMISFAWWQSQVLIILLLIVGNSLSYWLGVIAFVFTFPQVLLLFKYVKWLSWSNCKITPIAPVKNVIKRKTNIKPPWMNVWYDFVPSHLLIFF